MEWWTDSCSDKFIELDPRALNVNINEMRNSAQNTSLFSSDSYWESLAEKRDAYYTIGFLKENEGELDRFRKFNLS